MCAAPACGVVSSGLRQGRSLAGARDEISVSLAAAIITMQPMTEITCAQRVVAVTARARGCAGSVCGISAHAQVFGDAIAQSQVLAPA